MDFENEKEDYEMVYLDSTRMKEQRLRMGLSQKALSDLLQVNQTSISRWERIGGPLARARRKEIASALKVHEKWLCSLKEREVAARETNRGQVTAQPILIEISEENSPLSLAKQVVAPPSSPQGQGFVVVPQVAPEVPTISVAPPPPPQTSGPFETPEDLKDFGEVLDLLREEQNQRLRECKLRIDRCQTVLTEGLETLRMASDGCVEGLEAYHTALKVDINELLKARILGIPPAVMATSAVQELVRRVQDFEEEAFRIGNQFREVLGVPPRNSKGEVTPTRTREVTPPPPPPPPPPVETPKIGPVVVPQASKDNEVVPEPQPEEQGSEEESTRRVKNTVLLVGGGYPPHPDLVAAALREYNVNLEWVDATRKKESKIEDAVRKIKAGTIRGVILMWGSMSHTMRDRISEAVKAHPVPLGYCQTGGHLQVLKAVRAVAPRTTLDA
jgi:transcriptional regulator with XRE-family HTH domain